MYSIPYATITGEVQQPQQSLMSTDGKTYGVIRVVQQYTENMLFVPLLWKFFWKGKVSSVKDTVPFQVRNNEMGKDFHVTAPTSASITLEGMLPLLPVVLHSVSAEEDDCLLNWLVDALPGCRLILRNIVKEKMLPIKSTVTIMAKVLIGKDGHLSVLDPGGSDSLPYIITVLTPEEILKKLRCHSEEELTNVSYFISATVVGIVMLLINLYRGTRGKRRIYYHTTGVTIYLFITTFTTLVPYLIDRLFVNGV